MIMNTLEIEQFFKNDKKFLGVYSRDTLPHQVTSPAGFIFNTDTKCEPGEHWNAVMILPNGFGEFFNSFGFPPLHPTVQRYMADKCPKGFKYNCRTIQHPNSDVCGLYCVDYLKQRFSGMKMRKYLAMYTADLARNDSLVVERVTS